MQREVTLTTVSALTGPKAVIAMVPPLHRCEVSQHRSRRTWLNRWPTFASAAFFWLRPLKHRAEEQGFRTSRSPCAGVDGRGHRPGLGMLMLWATGTALLSVFSRRRSGLGPRAALGRLLGVLWDFGSTSRQRLVPFVPLDSHTVTAKLCQHWL